MVPWRARICTTILDSLDILTIRNMTPTSRRRQWQGAAREIRPMLAELVAPSAHERILANPELVFEPKHDGIRALGAVAPAPSPSGDGASVHLFSRLGNDKTAQFPEIVEPLQALARDLDAPVLLDGEIVAIDDAGHALGFQHLQGRINVKGISGGRRGFRPIKSHPSAGAVSVAFVVFDILRDGEDDLRARPFHERRARIEDLLAGRVSTTLRLIDSQVGHGGTLRTTAETLGWEGLIAKDPNGRYYSGRRHASWRKLKFVNTEEFVVGGWTEPRQSRRHFGALLLGYHLADGPHAGQLVFAGQVGSGFSHDELDRVAALLAPLIRHDSPFAEFPRQGPGDYWVEPKLVVSTQFAEWTLDGLLRQPVYLGLRSDKLAEEVVLPDHRPAPPPPRKMTLPASSRKTRSQTRARSLAVQPTDAAPLELEHLEPNGHKILDLLENLERSKARGTVVLSDGSRLPVGNLHKVFWPDLQITKGEFVRYYLRMAPFCLPVILDRPLVMKRFPNGVEGKSFYQHRAPDPLPDGLRVAQVRESPDKAGSAVPYLVGGRLQTLLYMAQLAVISQDPWFSRLPDITSPDQVALDLDPMPGASFADVLNVACWLHDELETLGTPSFPKTSGSKGIHIFIPLPPGTPYEAGMIFCQIVATVVATRHPEVSTVERAVKQRREGTVYIDYLQNIYGKTLACAYSARATSFAGVSTPLTWPEVHEGVATGLAPQDFTIRSIRARLDRVGDLWATLRTAQPADLTAALDGYV